MPLTYDFILTSGTAFGVPIEPITFSDIALADGHVFIGLGSCPVDAFCAGLFETSVPTNNLGTGFYSADVQITAFNADATLDGSIMLGEGMGISAFYSMSGTGTHWTGIARSDTITALRPCGNAVSCAFTGYWLDEPASVSEPMSGALFAVALLLFVALGKRRLVKPGRISYG